MNAIDLVANHRSLLDKELEDFQAYYNGTQPELIAALANKIYHMCINIGSPSSVKPMLQSIVKGNLKRWGTPRNYHIGYVPMKLPKNMHIAEAERCFEYVTKLGHFRWNFGRTYTANYETRNYIKAFFLDSSIEREILIKDFHTKRKFRIPIISPRVFAWDGVYAIEFKSPNGNEYRYCYYPDTDTVSCNFGGLDEVPKTEADWVRKTVKDSKNFK